MEEANTGLPPGLNNVYEFLRKHQNSNLGRLESNNEAFVYLNMKQKEISKLTSNECGEASVLLNQLALYLQNEINRNQAMVTYCDSQIKRLIAGDIDNVGGKYTPYEYRRELAIRQNESAAELDSASRKLQGLVNCMTYMTNSLRNLASSFDHLQQTKRSGR